MLKPRLLQQPSIKKWTQVLKEIESKYKKSDKCEYMTELPNLQTLAEAKTKVKHYAKKQTGWCGALDKSKNGGSSTETRLCSSVKKILIGWIMYIETIYKTWSFYY